MTGRTRVLLVEDVADIRRTTTLALDHAGFDVIEAADAAAALARIDRSVDVVLLDRGLPDVDGLMLIPRLREHRDDVHIIIVSALGTEAERVEGLLAGADDYLAKPASMAELIARVTTAARRLERGRNDVLHFDELAIDLDRRLVLRSGEPIDLTRQEFDLLGHLARNPERAVSRQELLEAAWTSSSGWQSTATVTEHVRRVRNKVERDPTNPRWIESVRGVGYRFKAPTTSDRVVAPAPRIPSVLIDGPRIVHASVHALELLGASSPGDVIGRDVASFVAPRSVGALSARQATTDAGRWPRPEIITLVRLDGREVHVEVATAPVEWDGRPVRQATLWPIEGRTERLRALVTGVGAEVSDAVIITDGHLRIESFNPAAEELYGWRERDVVGRRITEVIPWVGDTTDLLTAANELERDGRWHGTVQQQRADGDTIDVLATTTMLRDDAGRTVGVISVNRHAPSNGGDDVDDDADDALAAAIVRGIDHDEFEVVFQPIVRLADRATTGVEALVRWDHPTRGRLSPAAFIGAAERTGAIVELGAHVLRRACAQLARWRDAGHDIHLAVNLSARQLADERISEDVARAMLGHRFGPDVLWLEVTESALVEDLDVAATRLHELRDLGARISIDDFGTGWASLTYLHRFPIDALKVDSVFVKGLGEKPSATAIVRSIVSLGQELDMAVVAEGIETEQHLHALRTLGCTVGQGYLFAKPGTAAAIRLSS
ncbi:MAG: hypothetical protein QOD30_75 [Actinomycetota bacterium]|jgi:PAS domain S-box-containing protein|nr:hypothetical protein [Actinomycetota bacterium]